MIVKTTDTYTSLKPSHKNNEIPKIILGFIEEFNKNYANFRDVNLILDFSNNINIEIEEILLLSPQSEDHKNNSKSFVVVSSNIDIERMSDNLVVVPTFQEAVDVIEIEEIERDLGI